MLGEEPGCSRSWSGAIFGWRGRGSWALTDARDAGEAEIERRAAAYGLPPVVWPRGWPVNSLGPMRAAVWADRQGAGRSSRARRSSASSPAGRTSPTSALLDEIGRSVGVEGIREAIADPEVKRALREATEPAWERGVQGVPTLEAGRRLYFGDDRLEEAAQSG